MFGFLDLDKSYSGTYKVDLAIEQQRDVVCLYVFALLCSIFLGAVPIPHVFVAILNLPNPTYTLINCSVIKWHYTLVPHSNRIRKHFLTCINYNANLFSFQMNEGAGMTLDGTHHWVLLQKYPWSLHQFQLHSPHTQQTCKSHTHFH